MARIFIIVAFICGLFCELPAQNEFFKNKGARNLKTKYDTIPFIFRTDDIIYTEPQTFRGRIIEEDSERIKFIITRNKKEVQTFLPLKNVTSITRSVEYKAYPTLLGKASFGLGYGLNYGGLGANFIFYPQVNVGFFGAAGYAKVGFGYNVGTKIRLTKKRTPSRVIPNFIAMYGYNTAFKVKNYESYNKVFNGLSLGLGMDVHLVPPLMGSVSFNVFYRSVSSEASNYHNKIASSPTYYEKELQRTAYSLGYNFVF